MPCLEQMLAFTAPEVAPFQCEALLPCPTLARYVEPSRHLLTLVWGGDLSPRSWCGWGKASNKGDAGVQDLQLREAKSRTSSLHCFRSPKEKAPTIKKDTIIYTLLRKEKIARAHTCMHAPPPKTNKAQAEETSFILSFLFQGIQHGFWTRKGWGSFPTSSRASVVARDAKTP